MFWTFHLIGICIIGPVMSQFWSQPEQIHLSYGADPTQMVVTWVTQSAVNGSLVEYGPLDLHFHAQGHTTKFCNGGPDSNHTSYMHRAVMTGLKPGYTYKYHVGSKYGWSSLFNFVAQRTDKDWMTRFAVYGDMGNVDSKALYYIQEEAQKRSIDAVLHVGDFAYDMNDEDGYVGDAFMKQIEPVAAFIPYMTCPGNHEKAYNFSHYKNRFSMPGLPHNMFYSLPVGKVLIVSINTEVYYSEEQPKETIITQYQWLEETLKEANKPSRRAAQPWIIVMGHRPMYCSNDDGPAEHCNNPLNPIRVGINVKTRQYSLEDLFYKYGVDLQFYAHEHSYERLWPVYRLKVCNGTKGPYDNPTGPVHIVTGSAGDKEGQTHFDKYIYDYSAFHTDDYGYTRLTIINDTHVYLDQVSSDKDGAVIDKAMIIREKHGQGLFTCHKNV